MEALRVLDRELVQPERALDVGELVDRRLDHAEPDEPRLLPADRRRLGRLHHALVLAAAVAVVGTVDDHARKVSQRSFSSASGNESASTTTRPSSETSSARRNEA